MFLVVMVLAVAVAGLETQNVVFEEGPTSMTRGNRYDLGMVMAGDMLDIKIVFNTPPPPPPKMKKGKGKKPKPNKLKFKPNVLKKSDFSDADEPSTYEFRGDKYKVPPKSNTPLCLKWGPVVSSEELVLDLDVCGKVEVVLIMLVSVTKNNNSLGPYLAYADFLRKKYSNYFYIDSPKQFAITVSD